MDALVNFGNSLKPTRELVHPFLTDQLWPVRHLFTVFTREQNVQLELSF